MAAQVARLIGAQSGPGPRRRQGCSPGVAAGHLWPPHFPKASRPPGGKRSDHRENRGDANTAEALVERLDRTSFAAVQDALVECGYDLAFSLILGPSDSLGALLAAKALNGHLNRSAPLRYRIYREKEGTTVALVPLVGGNQEDRERQQLLEMRVIWAADDFWDNVEFLRETLSGLRSVGSEAHLGVLLYAFESIPYWRRGGKASDWAGEEARFRKETAAKLGPPVFEGTAFKVACHDAVVAAKLFVWKARQR